MDITHQPGEGQTMDAVALRKAIKNLTPLSHSIPSQQHINGCISFSLLWEWIHHTTHQMDDGIFKELVEIHHNLTGELSSVDWALDNWVTCQDAQQNQKVQ